MFYAQQISPAPTEGISRELNVHHNYFHRLGMSGIIGEKKNFTCY